MLPYLAIAAMLCWFAITTRYAHEGNTQSRIALIVLIAFTGLRYQVGYDWIAYDRLFSAVYPSFDPIYYEQTSAVLPVEPLYYALNVAVKYIGGSVELLFFIIAAFNLIVIDRVARLIAPGSRPLMWTIYFFIALVAVQFNIIRQALASSFVLLSLIGAARGERKRALAWLAAGMTVHVSVIMFLPVILFAKTRISNRIASILLGSFLVMFMSGALIAGGAFSFLATYAPAFVGSKAALYADGFASGSGVFGVTPAVAIIILMHLGFLFVFCKEEERPVSLNIAIALTLLVLFGHLVLSQFPSFWNRLMAVSLPWQVASFFATAFFQKLRRDVQVLGLVAVSIGGMGMMVYQLSREESLPFVPYHSLVQVWLFNDPGDGRLRAEYSIQRAYAEAGAE